MRREVIIALLAGGCIANVEPTDLESGDDETSVVEQDIQNGVVVSASSFSRRATVAITPSTKGGVRCTGTIIGSSHILTGSRCGTTVGATVSFFATGTSIAEKRSVDRVYLPNWVNPLTQTVESPEGQMRDIAVLHLSSPIPAGFVIAKLPTVNFDSETQDGKTVTAVGAGTHEGVVPTGTQLRARTVKILNVDELSANSDGGLYVSEWVENSGDGGGPIFASVTGGVKIIGVLWGHHYRPASAANRSYYTVVRDHVEWIKSAMSNSVAPTRILKRVDAACNTTVKFSNIGTDTLLAPSDSKAYLFEVASPNVKWLCNGTLETTACPVGTSVVRALRNPVGSRDFIVECRQKNPAT
jgi:hypothetical protein